MTRLRWLLPVLLCLSGCKSVPLGYVIEAQSLPVTRTSVWNANAASDQVINYTVSLTNPTGIVTVVGTPTTPVQVVTFAALGAHTVSVTATNAWGTSPPLNLVVNVNPPSAITNLRMQTP